MVKVVLLLIAGALAFYNLLLIRSYKSKSLDELKRLARSGNKLAKKVYPVRTYKIQLWLVLWTIFALLLSAITVLSYFLIGGLRTLAISVPLLILVHTVLPYLTHPKSNLKLAAISSPIIETILNFTFPVLSRIEKSLGRFIQTDPTLTVQDEKELLEIIRHSVKNPDVSGKEELEFTANLLILGEQKVSNFMTPIDKVALVKPDEQLTPKIMDELHQSRSSWFLVFRGNRQNVVGVLSATDAINLKSQKYIRDIMHSEVFYINEQQTITEALNIFLNTKQSILVVINQYKDVVGAILIEDVVKQIIAPMNLEQPNGYDDINVVANITAKNHTPNQS